MQIDPAGLTHLSGPDGRHPSVCALVDKSLAGVASAQEQQTLREHLANCAACNEYLATSQRAISALQGFRFASDPALDGRVLAALALRGEQLESNRVRRRQLGWGSLLALLLTAVGSFALSRLGGLAAPLFHLDPAQLRVGLTAFWIAPSLGVCLLLLLLPALHAGMNNQRGFSL